MKIPTTEEYVNDVAKLIRTQNRRVKKYIDVEADKLAKNTPNYEEVINKFNIIKEYVANVLYPALNKIKGNDIYSFYFSEGILADNNVRYIKLIIKNKLTNSEHFMVLTNDFRDFFVELRPLYISDVETHIDKYPVERFTKGKYRKIFFEYFLEIIKIDTLPKLKREKDLLEEEKKLEQEKLEVKKKINLLNSEIERIRNLAERNETMILEAKSKHSLLKNEKKEVDTKIIPE
ncbi:MAG: hypothetical protein FWG85_07665 [Bacteroidetes bacterium]|nr:hypothetical protein [Bacteroidota bacterium]